MLTMTVAAPPDRRVTLEAMADVIALITARLGERAGLPPPTRRR